MSNPQWVGGNGDIATGTNWSDGTAPGATDTPTIAPPTPVTVTVHQPESWGGVTLGAGNTLQVGPASSLTVNNGNADIAGTAQANSTSSDPVLAFIQGSVTVEVSGKIEATGADATVMFSGDTVTNSGTIIADNSGVVNFNTVPTNTGVISDTVDNFGSVTATSSGKILIQGTQFTNEVRGDRRGRR